MKNVKIMVNGIHCNGCANKIKNGIDSLKIQNTTDVEVETGMVKISYDETKASLNDLKAKITEAGFHVESVELE